MKISIIIPLFNQLTYTQQMYESLQETLPDSLDIEVIFVDDASSDGTSAWLRSITSTTPISNSIKSVRSITNPINLGFAKSNNRAARESKGDHLLLLNNDLVLKPSWLEPMLEVVNQNQSSPIIVGNLQYLPDTNTLDHAGIEVRLDTESNRPVIEHIRELIFDKPQKVFAVTGACCLIASKTFEELGGFDEEYVNGGEDVDLCMKVTQAGGSCWVVHASSVWHHVSHTRGRQRERDERNSWRLFQLWHKQIAQDLERICARYFAELPNEDPKIKKMAIEFIIRKKSLAPIAIKVMAQQYVQKELMRFNKKYH